MKLKHVRQVRTARGLRTYTYFNTGTLDAAGKPILSRLPDPTDPGFAAAYAAAMGLRTRRTATPHSHLLFPDLVRLYELSPKYRALAQSSRATYSRALAKLSFIYAYAPAASLTTMDIQELIDTTADRPGVANGYLGALQALYAWAKKRGANGVAYVATNPALGIDPFESKPIPPWPVEALRLALASDDHHVRVATALLYYTGQRVSDVIRMTWSSVEDGQVRLVQAKTKKLAAFPLHRDLAAILATAPRTSAMILTMKDGVRPATRTVVREWLKRFLAPLGFDVTTHGLRKNAVNALLSVGCPVAEVAAITRQSLSMVEYYARDIDQEALGSAAILKWEGKR